MTNKNTMNATFISIRKELFELINMIEIKIDVSYIIEEIEEISYEIKKIGNEGERIAEDMMRLYTSLFNKYKNKLAAFLSTKEANQIIEKIQKWVVLLPNLF
ncbi:MAG: hypothetical protein ACFFDS_04775 [Candidatus Thorarchaeota archaeon]